MFKQFDRLMVRGYVKAYVFFLISLLSLYIVVDLFTNLDGFIHKKSGLAEAMKHIGSYYGFQSIRYFDQMCEAIVLLAAMFTVAWMQRNNELLPLLSAGVSTRRVVTPVLGCACAMLSLTALNQEFLIPRFRTQLVREKDDPDGNKEIGIQGAYEPNGIHIEGTKAVRKGMIVKQFHCVIPTNLCGNLLPISAQEGRYIPPGDGPHTGGWLLTEAVPAKLERWDNPEVLECIDPGKYFLHTAEVDFDMITRQKNWFQLISTWQILQELQRPGPTRLSSMAMIFHMRLTRPILGLILVFLGLSIILRDQNRNVFISAALCLGLCGIFFATCFTCKGLGDYEYLSPALAAWLPVFLFGPMAIAMFDAVHT